MTTEEARTFVCQWIEVWNDRDLERVLSHYSDNIVLLSPLAQKRVGEGRVVGIQALRTY